MPSIVSSCRSLLSPMAIVLRIENDEESEEANEHNEAPGLPLERCRYAQSSAGSKLFRAICDNPQHVLVNLFPQHKNTGHDLRLMVHSYTLPIKDENNFIPRMLYTNIY